ncbi:hypothetical protein HJG60_008967 [Phyllostomus discolor]|uniref:Uncharacterized protein n=1 Tax=Phyllostomus discolor TaxID=89673 RepID=A0A833YUH6_9CHIR|nr:hypothetical protein HJG60_008967 [Phyllostomus discolor]
MRWVYVPRGGGPRCNPSLWAWGWKGLVPRPGWAGPEATQHGPPREALPEAPKTSRGGPRREGRAGACSTGALLERSTHPATLFCLVLAPKFQVRTWRLGGPWGQSPAPLPAAGRRPSHGALRSCWKGPSSQARVPPTSAAEALEDTLGPSLSPWLLFGKTTQNL